MEQSDAVLIRESAVLAGLVASDEQLCASDLEICGLLLREMRAETEAARLARRIARHYRIDGSVAFPSTE